jgi:hypothetical protein
MENRFFVGYWLVATIATGNGTLPAANGEPAISVNVQAFLQGAPAPHGKRIVARDDSS